MFSRLPVPGTGGKLPGMKREIPEKDDREACRREFSRQLKREGTGLACFLLLVGVAAWGFLMMEWPEWLFFLILFPVIGIHTAFSMKMLRCPACGGRVKGCVEVSGEYCTHCGSRHEDVRRAGRRAVFMWGCFSGFCVSVILMKARWWDGWVMGSLVASTAIFFILMMMASPCSSCERRSWFRRLNWEERYCSRCGVRLK